MILAFSTSSPLVSAAVLSLEGEVLASAESWAPRAASAAALFALEKMLGELNIQGQEVDGIVADLGPGSFTGVRVGVTLAKTLGYAWQRKVSGVPAYKLVADIGTVVLPSKRGEWFVFRPGCDPEVCTVLPQEPFVGYGHGVEVPVYPHVSRLGGLLGQLQWTTPERLIPHYIHAPSISVPRNPYGSHVRARGG